MQKRERQRDGDTHTHIYMHAHTHTHTRAHMLREMETEENEEPQMNTFDGPGERPPEISSLWSFPVYFNGHIWPFVPQCLQKGKHVSVKLIVYSTLCN